MPKIQIWGFKCTRCGHEWVPREPDQTPKVCPKCKSPYWDQLRRERRTGLRGAAGGTGFVGITQKMEQNRICFEARIFDGVRKRLISLGRYTTAERAAEVADDGWLILHGFRPNETSPGPMVQQVLELAEAYHSDRAAYEAYQLTHPAVDSIY